jgi:putative copper resistance protein D
VGVATPGHARDTGRFLDAARRSALASFGDEGQAGAILDSVDVDEDEQARIAYNQMLAELAHRDTEREG